MPNFRMIHIYMSMLSILVIAPGLSKAAPMEYQGSRAEGNYVWGGAMNLAWHEMTENILHEKLQLNTRNKAALEMAGSSKALLLPRKISTKTVVT